MSEGNGTGIIRIGRKGLRKFAFGEDGAPFEVDVVVAYQRWMEIDDEFRPPLPDEEGNRLVPVADMGRYNAAAAAFATELAHDPKKPNVLTVTEAREFIELLRQEYNRMADFFRPKLRAAPASPATSGAALRFSEEDQGQS